MASRYDGGSSLKLIEKESDRCKEVIRKLELGGTGSCYYSEKASKEDVLSANTKLVYEIANKFLSTGIEFDDLFSIGFIGLEKGYNTYNPKKGVKFSSYAGRCIENEILMHLRAEKKKRCETSIETQIGVDKQGNEITFAHILGTERDSIENDVIQANTLGIILSKMAQLSNREKYVLVKRVGLLGLRQTQQEIAEDLGISRSYVSRIEQRAYTKLKNKLSNERNNGEQQYYSFTYFDFDIRLDKVNPTYVQNFLVNYIYVNKANQTEIIDTMGFIELVKSFSKAEQIILIKTHGLINGVEQNCARVAREFSFSQIYVENTRVQVIEKIQRILGVDIKNINFNQDIRKATSHVNQTTVSVKSLYKEVEDYFKEFEAVYSNNAGAHEKIITKVIKQTVDNKEEDIDKMERQTKRKELEGFVKEFQERGILDICMEELSPREQMIVKYSLGIMGAERLMPKQIVDMGKAKSISTMNTQFAKAHEKFKNIKYGTPITLKDKYKAKKVGVKEDAAQEATPQFVEKLRERENVKGYLLQYVTEKQAELLDLRFGFSDGIERTLKEIAKVKKMPVGNIKTTIERGLRNLSRELDKEDTVSKKAESEINKPLENPINKEIKETVETKISKEINENKENKQTKINIQPTKKEVKEISVGKLTAREELVRHILDFSLNQSEVLLAFMQKSQVENNIENATSREKLMREVLNLEDEKANVFLEVLNMFGLVKKA